MIHPEDRERVGQALTDAVNGVREYDLDYRLRLPDGRQKVIHAQAEVLRNKDGKAVMMQGTVQDITERKLAELALQTSQERLRQIFEASPNVTSVFRMEGQDLRRTWVSPNLNACLATPSRRPCNRIGGARMCIPKTSRE